MFSVKFMCGKEEIWQKIHVKIRGKSVCAKIHENVSKVRGLYSEDLSGQLSADFSTWSLQQLPWQRRLYPPSQVLRIRHLGLNWGNSQNINTIETRQLRLSYSSLQSCVCNAILPEWLYECMYCNRKIKYIQKELHKATKPLILPEVSNNLQYCQRFTYFNGENS
jgi:hypothetical protein